MKLLLVALIMFAYSELCEAKQQIVVWDKNYHTPFLLETLQNIVALTDEEFSEIDIVPSPEMEQGRAFAELLKGNIDVVIAAADPERERLANVIYVPIDRGLLGFRVCLKHAKTPPFTDIYSANEFTQNDFSVGLGTHWPDTAVYLENGFTVVTSPVHDSLFAMLKSKRFSCFSRSVHEIDAELKGHSKSNIVADKNLIFIYPNANFIFVAPNNVELHTRLSIGIGLSIENYSFFDLFDKYHQNNLLDHGIYERKLLILENSQLSGNALSAINRFGIASFMVPVIETKVIE